MRALLQLGLVPLCFVRRASRDGVVLECRKQAIFKQFHANTSADGADLIKDRDDQMQKMNRLK